jgi:endonuclease III-like uncharacterized protein
VYRRLFEQYGAQGWWPLVSRAGAPGFDSRGYHPGRYRIPRQPAEGFEVAVGAVLTQKTSWRNAEAALKRLLAEELPGRAALFGEFHALIVRHAKEYCRKRALCCGCPLPGRFCGGSTRYLRPKPSFVPPWRHKSGREYPLVLDMCIEIC